MQRDTIRKYEGKMVRIAAAFEDGGHPIYYGRVSDYDRDFITLNPYCYERGGSTSRTKDVWDDLGKLPVGRTNKEITLGRKIVETIEEVFDVR